MLTHESSASRATRPTGAVRPPAMVDHSQEDGSRRLMDVQIVSGALFFGVAVAGMVDAIANFQPEVPLGDTYEPAPTTGAWHVLPSFSPQAAGAALFTSF